MKRVFSHPNTMIVGSMHALLEREGIEVTYRNEFLAGGAGELAPGETWLELWIVNEGDEERAHQLIREAQQAPLRDEWICNHCHEANPASFELCWHCGKSGE